MGVELAYQFATCALGTSDPCSSIVPEGKRAWRSFRPSLGWRCHGGSGAAPPTQQVDAAAHYRRNSSLSPLGTLLQDTSPGSAWRRVASWRP